MADQLPQMPQLPEPHFEDASHKIVAAFKSLDDMTMAALDAAGGLLAKGASMVGGAALGAAAAVSGAVTNAVTSASSGVMAMGAPGFSKGHEISEPAKGIQLSADAPSAGTSRSVQHEQGIDVSHAAPLTPMHTPTTAMAMDRGRGGASLA